jgi:ATP-dependent Clp protease ATP-binding subunit ClpX
MKEPGKKGSAGDILRCTFCNKSQRDVKKLIAGPNVYICDECVDICLDIIAEDRVNEPDAVASPGIGLIEAADKITPGQTEAKRILAAAFTEHAARIASTVTGSAAILIAGPTGTGKNDLVKSMALALSLPLAVIDVPLLFPDAPFKAKHEFPGFDTKPGIVVLNHLDAAAMRGSQKEETRILQRSLISILDGAVVRLAGEANSATIDTSRVLFVAVGTYADISLGPHERFGPEALIRYGYLPELVARFSVFLMLEALGDANLKEYLIRDGGLIAGYKERFKKSGLTITFDSAAVETLVRLGEQRKAGIRGLKAMLDSLAVALACEPWPEGQREFVVDEAFVIRNL